MHLCVSECVRVQNEAKYLADEFYEVKVDDSPENGDHFISQACEHKNHIEKMIDDMLYE